MIRFRQIRDAGQTERNGIGSRKMLSDKDITVLKIGFGDNRIVTMRPVTH